MALLYFLMWWAGHGAACLLLAYAVYYVVSNLVGCVTRGVWQSPIRDREAVWGWLCDVYEDHLEPETWAARRVERRRARGECLVCGYSLRGNLSGVCPECGTSTSLGRLILAADPSSDR